MDIKIELIRNQISAAKADAWREIAAQMAGTVAA